ncbi:MAG TPA: translocation/assembly module TamB domain-containing protein, partial [Blastocatellia bacterium]|nr:translocation/assembly module TamB domain-containing protein [Blastocatellia bacterium]
SSSGTRAQAIAIDGTGINSVSVGELRGEFRNGRLQVTAPRAAVSRVDVAGGRLSEITWHNLEARSNDGNYQVRGGLAIGSGEFRGARIQQVRAQVAADNGTITLSDLSAALMGGSATGRATLQTRGGASTMEVKFNGLNTTDLVSMFGDRRVPLAGKVSGSAGLNWPGLNVRRASGNLNADFTGQITDNAIPLNGKLALNAQQGNFAIDQLRFATDASTFTATGRFSLEGDSDLRASLTSSDAAQLQTIIGSFDAARELIVEYEPQIDGELKLDAHVTGKLNNPTVEGELKLASANLHAEPLGRLSARFFLSPEQIRVENALLTMPDGGTANLTYAGPRSGSATDGRLDAKLERLDVNSLIAAAGFPSGQQQLIGGKLSGEAHLTGLPGKPQGTARVSLADGIVAGQPAESAQTAINFNDQAVQIETLTVKLPQGSLTTNGSLDLRSKRFQVQGKAENIDLNRLVASLEAGTMQATGTADASFSASGQFNDIEQTKVEVTAEGRNVTINGRNAGELRLTVRTLPNARINAELVTSITGAPQTLTASIDLRQPGRPIEVDTQLSNFDLAPLMATFAPGAANSVTGMLTGTMHIEGPLFDQTDQISMAGLQGRLQFIAISLTVQGNPIIVTTPVTITLRNSALTVEPMRISGLGTELALGGTLGLSEGAEMNFTLKGTAKLGDFQWAGPDTTLDGVVAIDARVGGTLSNPRLGGEITLQNGEVTAGDLPVLIAAANGRVTLANDQITLADLTARVNDGSLHANGSIKLSGFKPSQWQFAAELKEVDFYHMGLQAIADGNFTLTGTPEGQLLSGTVTIPEAEYLTEFDLGEMVSKRGGG